VRPFAIQNAGRARFPSAPNTFVTSLPGKVGSKLSTGCLTNLTDPPSRVRFRHGSREPATRRWRYRNPMAVGREPLACRRSRTRWPKRWWPAGWRRRSNRSFIQTPTATDRTGQLWTRWRLAGAVLEERLGDRFGYPEVLGCIVTLHLSLIHTDAHAELLLRWKGGAITELSMVSSSVRSRLGGLRCARHDPPTL
jgi:hypothetical protein